MGWNPIWKRIHTLHNLHIHEISYDTKIKVKTLWDGHKIFKKQPTFIRHYSSNVKTMLEIFSNFCGLLIILNFKEISHKRWKNHATPPELISPHCDSWHEPSMFSVHSIRLMDSSWKEGREEKMGVVLDKTSIRI